jgi:hypothetical protein
MESTASPLVYSLKLTSFEINFRREGEIWRKRGRMDTGHKGGYGQREEYPLCILEAGMDKSRKEDAEERDNEGGRKRL